MRIRHIFVLAAAFFGIYTLTSCRAQIRNADLYPADPHLKHIVLREGSDEKIVQSIAAESRDPAERHDRAVSLARTLLLDESESAFLHLIQTFPEFTAGYVSLSRLYWIAGERDRSSSIMTSLASVSKIPDKTLLETAVLLDESGRSDEAGILLQSIAQVRRSGETCLLLGKRAYHAGLLSQALEHYRCAVDALPSNRESRLASGLLHAAAGNYRLAAGYLEGIPDDDARFQLARAYAQTDRVTQALRILQAIEKKDIASLELWGSLLLDEDLGADVRPVLNHAPEAMKAELLRTWFGTDNPEGREEMTRSLQSLR